MRSRSEVINCQAVCGIGSTEQRDSSIFLPHPSPSQHGKGAALLAGPSEQPGSVQPEHRAHRLVHRLHLLDRQAPATSPSRTSGSTARMCSTITRVVVPPTSTSGRRNDSARLVEVGATIHVDSAITSSDWMTTAKRGPACSCPRSSAALSRWMSPRTDLVKLGLELACRSDVGRVVA